MTEDPARFNNPAGIQIDQIGNPITIPAVGLIAPTHRVHHVINDGTISTITPPWPDFVGPLVLLADAGWTWDSNGNIASALPGVVEIGLCYCFYFDRQIDKWFPCGAVASFGQRGANVSGLVHEGGDPDLLFPGAEVYMTVDGVPWPGGPAIADANSVYHFISVAGGVIEVTCSNSGYAGQSTDTLVPPTDLTLDILMIGS